MEKENNNLEGQNESYEKKHKNSQSFFISLGMIASLFAVFGVILTLLGYGIVLGIASALNLDPGSLQTSSFDYISVSWIGFLMIFEKFNFREIIAYASRDLNLIWLIVIPLLLSGFFLICELNKLGKLNRVKVPIKRKIKNTKHWLEKLVQKYQFVVIVIKSIIKGLSFSIFPIVVISIGFVLYIVGYFIVIMVPLLGTGLGESYVAEVIDKNAICRPIVVMTNKQIKPSSLDLKNSQQQQKAENKKDFVTCARVITWGSEENVRGQEVARGRVIMSNSEFILLYRAGVGAMRIALKDQSTKIEQVIDVDPPSVEGQRKQVRKKLW